MSLQIAAQHLASKGRGGDELLVHMTRQEVAGLDALARRHYGQGLTTNPHTGLPEASLLGGLLPMILGIGGAMMGIPPMVTAAVVGGGTAMATGSLMKGFSAGLGAYGGGQIGGGMAAMGEGAAADSAATAAGGTATSATTPMYDAAAPSATSAVGNGFDGAAGDFGTGYASSASSPAYVNGMDAASDAATGSRMASMASSSGAPAAAALSPMDKMSAGIGAIGKPGSWAMFSNAMGGDKAAMEAGLMAFSPALADSMQPKMPGSPASNAMIRPYKYDQHSQRYSADTPYNAADANLHSFYASGGPVGFAGGGNPFASTGATQHPEPTASTIPKYTYDPVTQRFSRPAPVQPEVITPDTNAAGLAALNDIYFRYGSLGGSGGGPGSDGGAAAAAADAGDGSGAASDGSAGDSYAAGGGIGALAHGQGRFLKGPGDGVSDSIPATINGQQPARLATEEYVVPARTVSEIGNGSSTAGAKRLDEMVARVSRARRKTVGSRARLASDSGAHRMLPA